MFNFLNPALLWVLLAVALPILIHLFSRQRVRKIEFSSLIFLKSLEKTRLRAIKIKGILLLLIRSLIISCVVLAFARPSSKKGFTSKLGAEAKSSMLFLIDNSYRMGYEMKKGSLLSLAIKKGEELLKTFREGDELYLITYNSEPAEFLSQPTFDSSLIARGIRQIELSFEPADLDRALSSGFALLTRAKNENKEVYLVTDLEAIELLPLRRWNQAFKDKNIKLFIIRLTEEEKENWCLKKVEVEGVLEKDTPFEIKGIIKNYSQKPVQGLLVSLYLNGKRVSQTDLGLKEGEERNFLFTQSVKETGLHSGYIELSDDNLLVDNKRFFCFNLPEKIELLLVSSKTVKENHLRLALNPKAEEESGIEITQIDSKSFSRADISKFKVVIFSDYSGIKLVDLKKLDDFLNSGAGVLFFFGVGGEGLYSEICKKYLGSIFKGEKNSPNAGEGFLTLEKIDLFHPVFQPYIGLDKTKFPQIKFFSTYEIVPGKRARVLANFSSGTPALVESSYGSGKILSFFSSYDSGFSDLGEHTLFVPLIRRSVAYLSSSLFPSEELLVGKKIRKEYNFKKAERIELMDPENFKVSLIPEFVRDRLILKIEGLKKPGIYKLQAGNELIDQLAVNLDTKDSDLEPLRDTELKKGLKDNILVIESEQNLEQEVLKTRYGKELRKNFLWLVLGLLILEMLLSKNRRKDLEYFTRSGEEIANKV